MTFPLEEDLLSNFCRTRLLTQAIFSPVTKAASLSQAPSGKPAGLLFLPSFPSSTEQPESHYHHPTTITEHHYLVVVVIIVDDFVVVAGQGRTTTTASSPPPPPHHQSRRRCSLRIRTTFHFSPSPSHPNNGLDFYPSSLKQYSLRWSGGRREWP